MHAARRVRERAVFGCVGRKLVEGQRKILRSLRRSSRAGPSSCTRSAKGPFPDDDFGEIGALPFLVDQHGVGLRKGMEAVRTASSASCTVCLPAKLLATTDCTTANRFFVRCWISLREQLLARLRLLSLGDIPRDF